MAATTLSHHYVTVNGVKLHYVRQGAGEPLLLIHGWPGFWYEWGKNIPALAEHFDVIAPDMRGYAYSDKPELPPEVGYSDTAYAEDLKAFLDFYHLESARIVSHDFGAIWTQKFARLYPERVKKLMLFDPPYPGIGARWFELPHVLNTWYQLFHQLPLAEELVGSSKQATEVYLRHFLTAWSAKKDVWTDDDVAAYVEAYSQPGALRGGFNCYRAALRGGAYSGGGDLKVKVPTMVLWGDGDQILPYAWTDKLPEFFPQLTLKKMEGVGHFMMREDPERINAEILAFMRG
ncbi:MAG: alpha/beta hydrolase [Dehalococcoidia bacterium]|nr:MAG: alpha/beta hydrolase [Dehalococcoidia bacterium]